MPPTHARPMETLTEGSALLLVLCVVVLSVALGVFTCVAKRPAPPPPPPLHAHTLQPMSTMLSLVGGSGGGGGGVGGNGAGTERLRGGGGTRIPVMMPPDVELPPHIALPDGEELPHGSSARLKLRDPLQQAEIYQKCVRAPPNRTVWDSRESPPSYQRHPSGQHRQTALPHQHHSGGSSKPDLLQRTVQLLVGRPRLAPAPSDHTVPTPQPCVVVVPRRPPL